MSNTAKSWTVAFVGDGDIAMANAKQLIDQQLLPVDAQAQAILPDNIPRRGFKGLKVVRDLLENEFDIATRELAPEDFVSALLDAKEDGEEICLVLLGTADEDAVATAEAALEGGISVKDLCAALDDVEFEEAAPEPEPEPEPARRRGRPRKDATVTAEIAGPAQVTAALKETAGLLSAAQLLEQAIRLIVREEMHPGAHAFGVTDDQPEPESGGVDLGGRPTSEPKTVRAFVNTDGEYRRATKRSRVREHETEVMLTETEARDAGLTG